MSQNEGFLITINTVLAATPIWMYFLFVYLLYVGYRESRPRVISFRAVYFFPLIVVIISFETLSSYFTMTTPMVVRWLIAILVGIGLGWAKIVFTKVDVDRKLQFFRFSGSWFTFFVVITVLFIKNYLAYLMLKQPDLVQTSEFRFFLLAIAGVFSGMFVGRFLYCSYRFFFGPFTDLSQYRRKKISK